MALNPTPLQGIVFLPVVQSSFTNHTTKGKSKKIQKTKISIYKKIQNQKHQKNQKYTKNTNKKNTKNKNPNIQKIKIFKNPNIQKIKILHKIIKIKKSKNPETNSFF